MQSTAFKSTAEARRFVAAYNDAPSPVARARMLLKLAKQMNAPDLVSVYERELQQAIEARAHA